MSLEVFYQEEWVNFQPRVISMFEDSGTEYDDTPLTVLLQNPTVYGRIAVGVVTYNSVYLYFRAETKDLRIK